MKVALKNKDTASVPRLKVENVDIVNFLKLADSMPKRICDVIDVKGILTEY